MDHLWRQSYQTMPPAPVPIGEGQCFWWQPTLHAKRSADGLAGLRCGRPQTPALSNWGSGILRCKPDISLAKKTGHLDVLITLFRDRLDGCRIEE